MPPENKFRLHQRFRFRFLISFNNKKALHRQQLRLWLRKRQDRTGSDYKLGVDARNCL
jgi:primosomal protein N'